MNIKYLKKSGRVYDFMLPVYDNYYTLPEIKTKIKRLDNGLFYDDVNKTYYAAVEKPHNLIKVITGFCLLKDCKKSYVKKVCA